MILKIMCNHKDNLQPAESNSHIAEVTNNAIPQVTDLQQYQFVRDKERRQVRPPARYALCRHGCICVNKWRRYLY